MKHSGPGLLNVMQTRFPFVLVSAAAAVLNFVSGERKILVGGFRLFIARYQASFEVSLELRRRGNSRQRRINMYAKLERGRVSTAVVSWV